VAVWPGGKKKKVVSTWVNKRQPRSMEKRLEFSKKKKIKDRHQPKEKGGVVGLLLFFIVICSLIYIFFLK
jgi:hypothetical protein